MAEQTKLNFEDDFTEEEEIKQKSNIWDFNENPIMIGYLKDIEETAFGEAYLFDTAQGEMYIFSYSAIEGKITNKDIAKKIKIEYLGDEKSKTGRLYKNFKIWKKE